MVQIEMEVWVELVREALGVVGPGPDVLAAGIEE